MMSIRGNRDVGGVSVGGFARFRSENLKDIIRKR
jgi:hypothetical protein